MALYGYKWSHLVLYGPACSSMVLFDHVWSCMVPYGPVWRSVALFVSNYNYVWLCSTHATSAQILCLFILHLQMVTPTCSIWSHGPLPWIKVLKLVKTSSNWPRSWSTPCKTPWPIFLIFTVWSRDSLQFSRLPWLPCSPDVHHVKQGLPFSYWEGGPQNRGWDGT